VRRRSGPLEAVHQSISNTVHETDVVDLAAEGGKTVSGVTCGAGDIAILAQDRRKGPPYGEPESARPELRGSSTPPSCSCTAGTVGE